MDQDYFHIKLAMDSQTMALGVMTHYHFCKKNNKKND